MTTLELTFDTSLARVLIAYFDATGGDLTRTDKYGTHAVQGGFGLSGDGVVVDYRAPLGSPFTYSLDDSGDVTGQLDVDSPWLGHPTDPSLSFPVIVEDDDDWTWSAPGTAHDVIGSEYPVAVYSTRSRHTGTLTILAQWADRFDVKALLMPGSPLLLRVTPGCYLDDMWLWPQDVTRTKQAPHNPAFVRWSLSYTIVSAPSISTAPESPQNYWDVLKYPHTTWDDVPLGHVSWVDVLLTDHPHA